MKVNITPQAIEEYLSALEATPKRWAAWRTGDKDAITSDAIKACLALLEATPRRLAACTAGVDEARLKKAPGPKDWSPVEHLAHVRGCDDVWSQTVNQMLQLETPILPLVSPRDWAKKARYAKLDWQSSFETFNLKRAEYLAVLRGLKPADWARQAKIQNHVHSVFSQVARTVLHEGQHCEMVEAMLKKGK